MTKVLERMNLNSKNLGFYSHSNKIVAWFQMCILDPLLSLVHLCSCFPCCFPSQSCCVKAPGCLGRWHPTPALFHTSKGWRRLHWATWHPVDRVLWFPNGRGSLQHQGSLEDVVKDYMAGVMTPVEGAVEAVGATVTVPPSLCNDGTGRGHTVQP